MRSDASGFQDSLGTHMCTNPHRYLKLIKRKLDDLDFALILQFDTKDITMQEKKIGELGLQQH